MTETKSPSLTVLTGQRSGERLTIREPSPGQKLFQIQIRDGDSSTSIWLDRDEIMSLGQCLMLMAARSN